MNGPTVGRVFPECEVRARPIVVRRGAAHDAQEMTLAESPDVIEAFPAQRPDDPLRIRVLQPLKVEDWGKLLGDTPAVTAMLGRVLHHAYVLKCGPRGLAHEGTFRLAEPGETAVGIT